MKFHPTKCSGGITRRWKYGVNLRWGIKHKFIRNEKNEKGLLKKLSSVRCGNDATFGIFRSNTSCWNCWLDDTSHFRRIVHFGKKTQHFGSFFILFHIFLYFVLGRHDFSHPILIAQQNYTGTTLNVFESEISISCQASEERIRGDFHEEILTNISP